METRSTDANLALTDTHGRQGDTLWAALTRLALYIVVVMTPLVLLAVLRPPTDHGLLYELGKGFALLGFSIMAIQFVLAARLQWVEQPFGLDLVLRFHKGMGVYATFLLCLHPFLLAVGGDEGWSLLIARDVHWYIWIARVGLLLLLIHSCISVLRRSLRLAFERWRLVHNILAPMVLVLGFLHSWNASDDDLKLAVLRLLWVGLLGVAVLVYVYHRVVRPLWQRRHLYRVRNMRQETHNVWTLDLAPPAGEKPYQYLPGQFQFITLYRGRGLPVEEHHFTISSSPTAEGVVSSTIKQSGDFTASIGQTRPGDLALVHAPFGRFSSVLHPEERQVVFLAGGIGITPLMSMLRHMRDTRADRRVLLLYANRTENDIVFRDELCELEKGEYPRLTVVHILSRAGDAWGGETGHMDREKIERLCGGNLANQAFYVCCPPRMTEEVVRALRDLRVAAARIHFEHFSL